MRSSLPKTHLPGKQTGERKEKKKKTTGKALSFLKLLSAHSVQVTK